MHGIHEVHESIFDARISLFTSPGATRAAFRERSACDGCRAVHVWTLQARASPPARMCPHLDGLSVRRQQAQGFHDAVADIARLRKSIGIPPGIEEIGSNSA